jgi:Leucine-rich repeat (LRR) protein
MSISSSSSFYPPPQVTSTSPIDHTRQIIALGITERIALFCKTIFQSFLNLFFNYIDKAQLQLQWKEIYQGQKEVTLFPLTQNTSEMQPELAAFCHLYLNSNQKELKASGKGLQVLPESIGNLVKLRYLELNDNQLQSLPESIGNLVNLKVLWLSHNRLQSLPESIGSLVKLTYLNLFDNRLQSLPESIGNLVNLKCLRLSNNHFNFVPEGLFRLSNNCKISLENNSLSEEEIARVRQRIDQPGYRGPRFIF